MVGDTVPHARTIPMRLSPAVEPQPTVLRYLGNIRHRMSKPFQAEERNGLLIYLFDQ